MKSNILSTNSAMCLVGKPNSTDCMSAIFQNDRNSNGSSGVLLFSANE